MFRPTISSLCRTPFHKCSKASLSNNIWYMNIMCQNVMEEAKIPPWSQIHEHTIASHNYLGRVFREFFSYCCDGIWIGSKELVRELQKDQCTITPMCLYPTMWRLFDEKLGDKRGLSLIDLDGWATNQKNLASLVFNASLSPDNLAGPNELLVAKWRNKSGLFPAQTDLQTWAVQASLAYLFGDRFTQFDTSTYQHCLREIRRNMSLIGESFSPEEAALESQIWDGFRQSSVQALDMGRSFTESHLETPGLVHLLRASGLWTEDELSRLVSDLLLISSNALLKSALWVVHVLSTSTGLSQRLSEDPNDVAFIRRLLKETFRFFPVTPYLTRMPTQTIDVGGWEIPPGQLLLLSYFSMGRDICHYLQDEGFSPDRWSFRMDKPELITECQHATLPIGQKINQCVFLKMAEEQLIPLIQALAKDLHVKQSEKVSDSPDIDRAMDLSGFPTQPIVIEASASASTKKLISFS